MNSKKKVIIIALIGFSLFGYSQYAMASKIGVIVSESQILEQNSSTSKYKIQLEFDNPSLLTLSSGETDFFVSADDEIIGKGKLEPFTLPTLGKATTQGTFQTDKEIDDEDMPTIKIAGTSKYDILFTSIDVPFVYYPSDEQAREFIRQE